MRHLPVIWVRDSGKGRRGRTLLQGFPKMPCWSVI
jgi:hypothetical protein